MTEKQIKIASYFLLAYLFIVTFVAVWLVFENVKKARVIEELIEKWVPHTLVPVNKEK